MNALDKFFAAKGQFVKVSFSTEKKPAAAHKGTILRKETTGVFRAGINFANLKSVQEGIANGERGDVQPLPWGQWVRFPYLIEHKGSSYLRLYPAVNGKVVVSYSVNGQSVDKDTFLSFLTPCEQRRPDEPLECFTVKADNVVSIGDVDMHELEEAA